MAEQSTEIAVMSGVNALAAVLMVAALVSIVRSPVQGLGAKALWALLVLCVPIGGAVVWFFSGRPTPEERRRRLVTAE